MRKCVEVFCDICNSLISIRNYSRHYAKHLRQNSFPTYHLDHTDMFCKFCKKECKNKNSLVQHELRCKENPSRKAFQPSSQAFEKAHECRRGKSPWNKGLTADTDSRVKQVTEKLRGRIVTNRKPISNAARKAMSDNAKLNHFEKRFGHHKTYEYREHIFLSSYEVKVAEELDKNNVRWIQPERFKYIDLDGNSHHYTPDFYLPEYDVYLDPKNDFLINNINPTLGFSDSDKIRWVEEQNSVRIIIIDKESLSWECIYKIIMEG